MSEQFARGRSAEVFKNADGTVTKLFFADYPRENAEKEFGGKVYMPYDQEDFYL